MKTTDKSLYDLSSAKPVASKPRPNLSGQYVLAGILTDILRLYLVGSAISVIWSIWSAYRAGVSFYNGGIPFAWVVRFIVVYFLLQVLFRLILWVYAKVIN